MLSHWFLYAIVMTALIAAAATVVTTNSVSDARSIDG